ERGCDHAAHHDLKSKRLGGVRHRERFGQSAGLVELDVDGVIATAQSLQRSAVMHALVGTDRKRSADTRQRLILARWQWLLDQRDAGIRAGGKISFQIVRRPSLI